MSWIELALIYFAIGGIFAVLEIRSAGVRWALPAFAFWPIWAPFALRRSREPEEEMVDRIDLALREGVEVSRGTDLDEWISDEKRQRVVRAVQASESRRRALQQLLAKDNLDPERARERLLELERIAAPWQELAAARRQLDCMRQLEALREQELGTLRELAATSEALRGQLVLARFLGSKARGPSAIVPELWGRVETLSAAMRSNVEAQGGLRERSDALRAR